MADMFTKLLMAREIRFKEGEISLLGERIVMMPLKSFAEVLAEASENPVMAKRLYYRSKDATKDGYSHAIKSKYGLTGMRLIEWLMNTAQVAGWGNFSVVRHDVRPDNVEFVFHVKNPPIIGLIKSAKPVDNIFRGLLAGGGCTALDMDIDVIETKCVAQGNPYCEFVAKRREQFLSDKNNPLVAEQLEV